MGLRRLIGLACIGASLGARADNPAEVLELPQVQVIGVTPLPGSEVPLEQVPANVRSFTSRDLRRQGATTLGGFLERSATGITVNDAQGNPNQPDINFRGFTASPLLGTPQGLSLFVDGMRMNEPFGDSVNWDLVPQSAISSIQIVPGSNPAFGLNTLGGAIALYTKSGASEYPDRPGGSVSVTAGSFGRRSLTFEAGGRNDTRDWFVTGHESSERGWARHNPSRLRQLFGKFGWQDDASDLDLTVGVADNRLEGTQTLPVSFADPREAYTWPDVNTNRAASLALKGSRSLGGAWLVSGNAYLRQFRNRNLSSNVDENADVDDALQATDVASTIDQTSHGLGLQLVHSGRVGGRSNKLSIGASIDRGRARYQRSSRPAAFTADRGTVAAGDFVPETDADAATDFIGVFGSDAFAFAEHWTLTLAGRYNRADVRIADRSGSAPQLDGTHRFERFNPAVGLNFNPVSGFTAYAGYNEGMRAPTAIELTCADPNLPCRLPNSFLADPPLKKVVSKTVEIGARGRLQGRIEWNAALFRTVLHDDLQFVSSNGTALNSGYFQNVGRTRRQGFEAGATLRTAAIATTVAYALTDATYLDAFVHNSPANSTADANGAIEVQPGNRIPGIARHVLKLRVEVEPMPRWTVAVDGRWVDGVVARGDENNLDAGGRVPGHALLNVATRWQFAGRWSVFGRIDNLFDRRYASYGQLGRNVFTGPGGSFGAMPRDEQFRGYGAPRGAWIGLEASLP